jgi:uncharacterized protein (DUF58 family)
MIATFIIVIWLALNAAVFLGLYFKPLPARSVQSSLSSQREFSDARIS